MDALLTGQLRQVFPTLPPSVASAVLSDWEAIPYLQDGEIAGMALVKGTEFHCRTLPNFKLRRKQMRDFIEPLFKRYGMLTTKLPITDVANQRFNKTFGFQKTWCDGQTNYFIMTELPFGKGEK